MSLRLPYELLLDGGGGRAKGFGGPVAPALIIEFALGEGGGRTTPDECEASVRAGVAPVVPESFGDESAVALPASDCSLGICTLSRGFLGSVCRLLVREGGWMADTEDVDWERCGGCCWLDICAGCGCGGDNPLACSRAMAVASIEWDRFSCLMNN
jgi:hypothetical protein